MPPLRVRYSGTMIVASLSEFLGWLGGASLWFVSNLGAPVLTGAVAGLAVPFVFRWESKAGEVRRHNREATDLNEDFRRFMSDLDRQVEGVVRRCLKEKGVEDLRTDVVAKQRAEEGRAPVAAILEADSPDITAALRAVGRTLGWTQEVKDAMFDALWRYRDEALRKRGKFIQLVEAEGKRHERYRRRKGCTYPALKLSEEARKILALWRERPNLFEDRAGDLLVHEDLTATERDLSVLETEGGFTWEAAKEAIRVADSQVG